MSVENGGSGSERTARGRYSVPDDREFEKEDHHRGWNLSMKNALENADPSLHGKLLRVRHWVIVKPNPGSVCDYITELHDEGDA